MSVLLAGFKLVKLLYVRYSNQHIQPIFNVSCLKVLAMTLRGETILRVLPELLALTPQALKSISYTKRSLILKDFGVRQRYILIGSLVLHSHQ